MLDIRIYNMQYILYVINYIIYIHIFIEENAEKITTLNY